MGNKFNLDNLPCCLNVTDLLQLKGGRSLKVICEGTTPGGMTESDICGIRSTAIVNCDSNCSGLTSDLRIDSIPDSEPRHEVNDTTRTNPDCIVLADPDQRKKALRNLRTTNRTKR